MSSQWISGRRTMQDKVRSCVWTTTLTSVSEKFPFSWHLTLCSGDKWHSLSACSFLMLLPWMTMPSICINYRLHLLRFCLVLQQLSRDYIDKAISRYRLLAMHHYDIVGQSVPTITGECHWVVTAWLAAESPVCSHVGRPDVTSLSNEPGTRRSSQLVHACLLLVLPQLLWLPLHHALPSLSCGSKNYPSTTVKSLIAHSRSPLPTSSLPLAFLLGLRVTWYRDTNCYDNQYGFSATI